MNIDNVRSANGFMRSVASIVLVTYSTLVFSPTVQAMQQAQAQRAAIEQADKEARSNLGLSLTRTKDVLRVLAERPDSWKKKASSADRRAAKEALRASRDETRQLIEEVRSEFAATGAMLEAKKLPEVIRQRQAEAVAKFEEEVAAFNKDLDDAIDASDEATEKSKAEAALKRLERHKLGRSHQDFDPNNLPNSVLKPDRTRTPKTSVEAFQAALLTGESSVRLAQIGGFDFSHLPGADNPTYLEATTEVVLSDDIKAKAAELHNSPVEIYNWVRNNVQWQPTWGAIQDASHTLSAQRGNAFDISSLTIALLRASGIPARYVHGVIEVPEAKFRNWAGGFENLDAAIDFASAGGIPITSVISGGKISKVRVEHVWVEAAVDFIPSRGVKNRSADSWVPMDPSFKQGQQLAASDALASSDSQLDSAAARYLASGTTNASEGWASGFDPSILETAQSDAKAAMDQYIDSQLPSATMGQVLGGRKIVVENFPVLPAALPNRIVVTGTRYASIPASLQQQITFAFGKDLEGYPIAPKTFPWAQLNNQQITLSFRPATPADESAMRAFFPGQPISNVSQIPSSIPAYLVNVVPELAVNGQVVMTGGPMTLGTDLTFVFNPKFVSEGEKQFSYALPAGSYLAIGTIAGSVSGAAWARVNSRAAATEAALTAGNANLSRERLVGDLFHTGILAYYDQYVMQAYYAGLFQKGHHQLAAGLGSFGYEPNVDTFFGVPRKIKTGGAVMNIPIVNIVGMDAPQSAGKKTYTTVIGALSSALENAVPETLLSTDSQRVEGISAVKAITKAAASGQRIYDITASNAAAVLPLIHHDSATMSEISSAVAAGKRVITHTDAVSVPGWHGAGYVILDQDTGAGAWKIAGGQNGGGVFWVTVLLLSLLAALALVSGQILEAALILGALYNFRRAVEHIAHSDVSSEEAYHELKNAAAIALLEVFGGKLLGKMAHAAEDPRIEMLEYMMTAWVWEFEYAAH